MSVNENIGLKMTISNRKQTQMYKLKIPSEDDLEPNLGQIIDRIPACLDPSIPKEQRFDSKIMS